ncbi:tenascin isoform X1 [Brachionus plicatilis]|uniref:Tenascin isoform X1 n=1 Tax=Brachionus plicatilis TaxID=10195 RepID=A0A3M7QJT3_BRAPC|nr:tenascin isoform X1 [Brachionus plicatilis]
MNAKKVIFVAIISILNIARIDANNVQRQRREALVKDFFGEDLNWLPNELDILGNKELKQVQEIFDLKNEEINSKENSQINKNAQDDFSIEPEVVETTQDVLTTKEPLILDTTESTKEPEVVETTQDVLTTKEPLILDTTESTKEPEVVETTQDVLTTKETTKEQEISAIVEAISSTKLPSSTSPVTSTIFSTTPSSVFQSIYFNRDIVIVWELCGVDAKTETSIIFQSYLTNGYLLSVWYSPSLNSLIFESNSAKQVLNLQINTINTLFFIFNYEGQVDIYVDCPKSNQFKITWQSNLLSQMTTINLYKNAHGFLNLEAALSTFKCRDVLSIIPGTVIHFTGQLNLVGSLIFSFSISNPHQDIIYSFNFINGHFQVISNIGEIFIINLNQTITNGFYIYFTTTSVQIFTNCPYQQTYTGVWTTNLFNTKVQLETSRIHHVGNGGSSLIMQSFCTTNNLINIIESNSTTCYSIEALQTHIAIIDKGNSYTNIFLPNKVETEKIEYFNSLDRFSYAYLMNPVHKILIASRINAKPRFFYRPINDYIEGFSDGQSNFWIGLDILNKVTNKYNYKLRIETENGKFVEEYKTFRVGNQESKYKLNVSDPIIFNCNGFSNHNGYEFSAYNFGQYSNMAIKFNGAFWHRPEPNRFCFSCETGIQNNIIYFNNYQFGGTPGYQYTKIFRMYLIP